MELITGGFGLLEGARWYPGRGLLFADMTRGGLYGLAEPGAGPTLLVPHRKGIGGLVAHRSGGLVMAGRNIAHKTSGAEPRTTVLLETGPDEMFFNDLTADGRGRLFAGSVAVDPTDGGQVRRPGRLYCIDLDGTVTVLADDVLVSNGLGTAPADDVLYHVDTGRRVVWALPCDGDAPPARRRVFVDTSEYPGVPDGLTVAADGSVWVAMAGGGVVVGWDSGGTRIAELAVPQALVTTLCLGGPELRTLFVLTGHNHEYPDPRGGCVYSTPHRVAGLPAPLAAVPLAAAVSSAATSSALAGATTTAIEGGRHDG